MKSIQLNEFLNFKFLSRVAWNQAGDAAAFVVSKPNEVENNYQSVIWLYRNNKLSRLTGSDKESFYIWEDDSNLLFAAARDSKDKKLAEKKEAFTSFYRISISGGEAEKAFTIPLPVLSIKPMKKDEYLIAAVIDLEYPDWYLMSDKEKEAAKKKREENKDYEVFEEIPWWSNGGGYRYNKRTRLFIYNSKKNKLEAITPAEFDVGSFELDSTKTKVVYTGAVLHGKVELYDQVYSYDIASKKRKAIYDKLDQHIHYVTFFGKDYFALKKDGVDYGINQNPSFYLLNEKGVFNELHAYDNSVGSTVGSDCRYGGGNPIKMVNGDFYFLTTIRNASHLYRLKEGRLLEKLIELEGSIDGFDIVDNKILFVAMYQNKLQELYEYSLETGKVKQVSKFNEAALKGKYVATPKKMTIKSRDTEIDGWVLEPINYDKKKKYPAILDIHGGPKTVYGEVFYHEMQYWASEGYFVFFCNPVGSDGRGNEFMDIRGKYGTIDYQDIMNFTDAVLKEYPAINTKKVAVTGGSYGGFMTNWIIGHTDRFAAAASQRSISNWLSFYGTSDIGTYFTRDQQGVKDVIAEADKLWERSPLSYVNNVVTPTLFIHSDEDYRCWIPEAMQMFTALKDRGIEARFAMFHGENHELSRSGKPLHRIKRLTEITEWIKKYTK